MSTYYTPGAPLAEGPQRPRKKRRRIIPALFFAGGCLLGFTVANAGDTAPQPAAAEPTPAPTVTETVEVEVPGPVETKTVEVPGPEREVAPAICATALDYADQGFTIAGEVLTALQAGIASGDFSGADAGNEKMSALAPKYNAAKAACRAAK